MTATAGPDPVSGMRRVTVVAPRTRMDVGLPAQCTLTELVPQLVRLSGAPAQPGPPGGAWSLSRLGSPPLPPGMTVSGASVVDGEVLHLTVQPRFTAPLLFDDVVDAIASAALTRRGAWRPTVGRRLALAVAAVLFVGTTVLALAALAGRPTAAVAAGVLAVALLLAGGALAKAYADVTAAATCAGAGTASALAAGLVALPPHRVWPIDVGALAVGLAAVAVHAALVVAVVHRHVWFVGTAVGAAAGALVTSTVLLFDVSPPDAAAVAAVVLTAVTAAVPKISLRLAGLPLPDVPEDMDTFRADERPALGDEVHGATSAAAGMLTGLVTALGAVVVGCCAVVLTDGSTWSAVLVSLLGITWLLRSRSYAGAVQRVSLIVIGLSVLTGIGYRAASGWSVDWLFAVAALVALAGALSVVYARRVGNAVQSPFRARWLDVLEYVALISLLPVTGAVLDVYNAVRDAVA